jgi:ATP-dependent exoDNAse (exonuclease V) alpha subunit
MNDSITFDDDGILQLPPPKPVSLKYTPRVPAEPKRSNLIDAFNKGYDEPTPDSEYIKKDDTFEVDGIKLSPEQQQAVLATMNSPKPVRVITGRAGAGKSLIIKYLRKRYGLKVCATTGKAAVNIGGTTVHGLFAYDSDKSRCFSSGYRDFNMSKSSRDIVLDEASMCGEKMAVYLGDCLSMYNKRLILVGDWAQASPVKDTWMFGTSFWQDALFTRLNECHRQNDRVFVDALDQARGGRMDPSTQDLFRSRVNPFPQDTPGMVRMYATNKLTAEWNARKLREHVQATGNQVFQLDSTFIDERDPQKQKESPRNEAFAESAIEDSRMAHQSLFAVGAQVIISKNAKGEYDEGADDIYQEYVNGDTGVIEDILNVVGESLDRTKNWVSDQVTFVVVRRHRDGKCIRLPRRSADTKDALDRVTHRVLGFPLLLGWAMSIHKSQGMTVDNAWLDMNSILSFPRNGRHGLGYVGLSRTRTLEGLSLSAFVPDAVVCDDEVRPWL